MNNILFFDTETTGKADFRAPAEAEHQPRLVQLGALLTDETGRELAAVDLIVKPEGFEIPPDVSRIHGITQELALAVGVDRKIVLRLFAELHNTAAIFVAHNIGYDEIVMDGEYLREGWDDMCLPADGKFCTMQAMTPVCQLPGTYGYKWPKLQEAHVHAFGKEFDGAHNAMADVVACKDVYFWLKKNENTIKPT